MRIQKLPDAKHIFSHVEWHMTGYAIRVAALEEEREQLLFVEPEDTKEQYPIPGGICRLYGLCQGTDGEQKGENRTNRQTGLTAGQRGSR